MPRWLKQGLVSKEKELAKEALAEYLISNDLEQDLPPMTNATFKQILPFMG
jgi:hypothetical protein